MPVLPELEALLAKMDHAYRETAKRYGFVCNGCIDSCCRSLFYHHTFLEYFYIHLPVLYIKYKIEVIEEQQPQIHTLNPSVNWSEMQRILIISASALLKRKRNWSCTSSAIPSVSYCQ